jgi:hypothetical protein
MKTMMLLFLVLGFGIAHAQDTTQTDVQILPSKERIKDSFNDQVRKVKKKKEKTKEERKNVLFAEYAPFWGTLYNGKLDYTDPNLGISSAYGTSNSKSGGYLRRIHVTPRRVRLAVGVAIGQSVFNFAQNIDLSVVNDTVGGLRNDTLFYSKNQIRSTQFQIPILVQLRLGGKPEGKKTLGDKDELVNPIRVSFGIIPSIMLKGDLKRKYTVQETQFTEVKKANGLLNPLQVYATARINIYGSAGLFINYDLNRFFRPHLYPKLNALSIGITLGGAL